MSENEVNMSATSFFGAIIVSVIVGASITYLANRGNLFSTKETTVVRDSSGRVKSIIQDTY